MCEHENNLGRESLQYISEGMAEKELAIFWVREWLGKEDLTVFW